MDFPWLMSWLERLWSWVSRFSGRQPQIAVTDSTGVVTARELKSKEAKGLKMTIDTVSDPDNHPGKDVGPASKATYTATGGGVICADKISIDTIDGNIDLSISVKKSN